MGFETKLNKRVNRKRMLRQVLCIALLALAVRLFMYVLTVPNADLLSRDRDASQYHRWAHGLLGYGSFAKPWGDGEWHPDATYTPGYAAFLAAVYGLCGERPAAALAVQAVVNSVGIGCFYWICAHVVGLRLAFVAAILWAVDPFVALHDLTLMTEGIATLLVGLGLGILLLASEGPAPRAGLHAIYGMISGVGALIRPALQFWVVAALLPVLVKTIVRRWRMGVMAVAAAVSAYTGTILPWCLRNYLVVGTPKLTTFSGEQLYIWWAGTVIARRSGEPFEVVKNRLAREEQPRMEDWREQAETDRVLSNKALSALKHDLSGTVICCLKGWLSTLLAPNRAFWARMLGPSQLVEALCWVYWVLYLLLLVAAVWGLMTSRSLDAVQKSTIVLSVLYLVLVAGPVGYPRFRVPIMPHFYLLAASGFLARGVPQLSGNPSEKSPR